jgi:flagellar hook-basal body complex protein FliE
VPIEGPSLTLLAPHTRVEPLEIRGPEANGSAAATGEGVAVFEGMLKNLALSANERIHQAQQASAEFAAGKVDDIHGTMLTLSKADIELRVFGNVRNRIVDAFYELWRMQI